MSAKVTIYDIAQEAGVSVATVSRILTGSAPVRPDTRKKVETVLRRHKFRPNNIARNLSYRRSMMIGVILPDITNPFFSTVFAEMQRHALARDYSLLLFNAMNSLELESEGLAYLSRHQVDGLIFMGGRVDEIALSDQYRQELTEFAQTIPSVIVNGGFQSDLVSSVHTDENSGINQAVAYLTQLGHTRIGMLGGSDHVTATHDRQRAFREAMQAYQQPLREEWMISVPDGFSIESGEKTLEILLQQAERPSAILCINDLVALGVLKAARHHQLDVPRDLSVVGFDNVYLTTVSTPELTTVSHNYPALGQTTIETVVSRISEEQAPSSLLIDMELVVRDSCCPIHR